MKILRFRNHGQHPPYRDVEKGAVSVGSAWAGMLLSPRDLISVSSTLPNIHIQNHWLNPTKP